MPCPIDSTPHAPLGQGSLLDRAPDDERRHDGRCPLQCTASCSVAKPMALIEAIDVMVGLRLTPSYGAFDPCQSFTVMRARTASMTKPHTKPPIITTASRSLRPAGVATVPCSKFMERV